MLMTRAWTWSFTAYLHQIVLRRARNGAKMHENSVGSWVPNHLSRMKSRSLSNVKRQRIWTWYHNTACEWRRQRKLWSFKKDNKKIQLTHKRLSSRFQHPYYCTWLVSISVVIELLAVWRYNKPKTKNQKQYAGNFADSHEPLRVMEQWNRSTKASFGGIWGHIKRALKILIWIWNCKKRIHKTRVKWKHIIVVLSAMRLIRAFSLRVW